MLAADVQIHTDGGGKVRAFAERDTRSGSRPETFRGASGERDLPPPVLLRTAIIDGLPGYVALYPDGSVGTTALDLQDGRIRSIHIVRNPDKLKHIGEAC